MEMAEVVGTTDAVGAVRPGGGVRRESGVVGGGIVGWWGLQRTIIQLLAP